MIDTSLAAYASIYDNLPHARREVLDSVRGRGETGATVADVAADLGTHRSSISGRLTELGRAGLIKRTGTTRMTDSGRSAHIWVA